MSTKKNMGLSNFLSLEFFGFGGSNHGSHQHQQTEESIYSWITDNTRNSKLTDGHEVKDGTIAMRGEKASMFVRNGKEIDNVLNEFKKDFHTYDTIFKAHKGELQAFGKEQNNFITDLDRIASHDTTFDQVRNVILKYKAAAKKYSIDNSIASRFHEPSDHFLGDYKSGFMSRSDHAYFESKQEPNANRDSVELQTPSEKELADLVKLGFDIQKLQLELTDLDEEVGTCIDHTDSPLRGFYSEISDDNELMEILNPFSEHGMSDEDHNAGLIDVLVKRVDNLYEALWTYIKRSVRPGEGFDPHDHQFR